MNISHPNFSLKDLTREQILDLIYEYPLLAMKLLKNKEWSGDLYLGNCTALQSLPKGLRVGGFLDLGYCTSLKSLPEGLVVGGNLSLWNCTSLKSLPEGLVVGGNLSLVGCPLLKKKYKDNEGLKKVGVEVQSEVFW